MQRVAVLCLLLMVVLVSAVQAQAPATAPKPDPALKKVAVFVGHWTWEGEVKAGPWGSSFKGSGEYDGRMILEGFFFQGRWTEKGAMGGLEIVGYDPVNKNFIHNGYWDD